MLGGLLLLYRIDYTHLLGHMVDYFTREEMLRFQYVVVSHAIGVHALCANVRKTSGLFPDMRIRDEYMHTHNKELLKRRYRAWVNNSGHNLKEMTSNDDYANNETIYHLIVVPVLNHMDVIIVCDAVENVYLDEFLDYVHDTFCVSCIDLNKLFSEGETDIPELDYHAIKECGHEMERILGNEIKSRLMTTHGGRLKILSKMSLAEKLQELKKCGVKIKKSEYKRIDDFVLSAWAKD